LYYLDPVLLLVPCLLHRLAQSDLLEHYDRGLGPGHLQSEMLSHVIGDGVATLGIHL
jgi:hypothetical protein